MFVSKVVPNTQASDHSQLKIGHWIEYINDDYVRDVDSRIVAEKMDNVERPFRKCAPCFCLTCIVV